jgi:hypothetical protein
MDGVIARVCLLELHGYASLRLEFAFHFGVGVDRKRFANGRKAQCATTYHDFVRRYRNYVAGKEVTLFVGNVLVFAMLILRNSTLH